MPAPGVGGGSAVSLTWLWVPPAIVVAVVVILALRLLQVWIRRRRCPHNRVRLVRQLRHYQFYFAEVCQDCGASSGAKP